MATQIRPRGAVLILVTILTAGLGSGLGACQPTAPVAEQDPASTAAATAGQGADSATADPAAGAEPLDNGPWFVEEAVARGIDFRHQSGADPARPLFPEIMVGGAALFDMDGDGDLDAYLVQSGSLRAPAADRPGNQLFRNDGDGRFTDVSEGSGADDRGFGAGVAAGDYDNDGDTDLYVTNVGSNALLRNDGGGRFSDVTAEAGVAAEGWSASAAWLDLDRDGDLDLYVSRYLIWSAQSDRECFTPGGMADYCGPRSYNQPQQDLLYRNQGDGRFKDASSEMGLGAVFGTGLGVAPGDFDDDGWPDIFVANDGLPNQLWMNRAGQALVDEAPKRGVAVDEEGQAKAGMGTAATDLDDDGDLDLLVVNLHAERDSLYINQGGYFSFETARWGLGQASPAFTRFGTGLLDLDNDGWLDLFLANGRVTQHTQTALGTDPYAEAKLLFRGLPERRFRLVTPQGGTEPPLISASRAAAFGDVDDDGRVDVLIANRDGPAQLLRNIGPRDRHWALLRVLERHGRDAYGARLTVDLGGRTLTREVQAAYSYLASNDPRVHLGLGAQARIPAVTVRWPTGETEAFGPFDAVDQVITLRQGGGRATGSAAAQP
ncbi:MAG TPA: CRTAC1 family protein [Anaerolineae bacterium]|nr:CRTAC1 family protein [Anaerolineae bacterium]